MKAQRKPLTAFLDINTDDMKAGKIVPSYSMQHLGNIRRVKFHKGCVLWSDLSNGYIELYTVNNHRETYQEVVEYFKSTNEMDWEVVDGGTNKHLIKYAKFLKRFKNDTLRTDWAKPIIFRIWSCPDKNWSAEAIKNRTINFCRVLISVGATNAESKM